MTQLSAPDSTLKLLARWTGSVGSGPNQRGNGMATPRPSAETLQARLGEFIELLLRANRDQNLTGDRDPLIQWRAHIEDALENAILIEQVCGPLTSETRILDIGSGAGAPGLIWALLWPHIHVALLESTRKKTDFLLETVQRLGIAHLSVICERAEMLAHDLDHREHYDWVSARALAPLSILAEWTLPFVKKGGMLFAIKGERIDEELKASRRAFRLLGAPNPPRRLAYTRADGKSCVLLAFAKSERTPSPYPRRLGVARKSPL